MRTHKSVDATPEEMAYEPPASVDFSKGFVIQGLDAWREYRKWRRNLVRVRADLREAFPTEADVNEALETYLKLLQSPVLKSGKRKTA